MPGPRVHRFSRISIHDQAASSRKLCDRVDTWRALCTYTKRHSCLGARFSIVLPGARTNLPSLPTSPPNPTTSDKTFFSNEPLQRAPTLLLLLLLHLSIAIFFSKPRAPYKTGSDRPRKRNEGSRERNRRERIPT